jgi:hypothetical protein
VIAIALCVFAAPIRGEVVPESRLKAAFVSKFPQFVEWPAAATDGRETIDICVASPDPFGTDLQELLTGEVLNGRGLNLRHVNAAPDVDGCHMLFLPARKGGRHPLLTVASGRAILTVSDDPGFLDDGGIVALRVVDGRVRFEIDDAAARRVGLRISSQLLRLALAVRGGTS